MECSIVQCCPSIVIKFIYLCSTMQQETWGFSVVFNCCNHERHSVLLITYINQHSFIHYLRHLTDIITLRWTKEAIDDFYGRNEHSNKTVWFLWNSFSPFTFFEWQILFKRWCTWKKLFRVTITLAGNYMFEVNNRNTKTRCEICSKLTIKKHEQRH